MAAGVDASAPLNDDAAGRGTNPRPAAAGDHDSAGAGSAAVAAEVAHQDHQILGADHGVKVEVGAAILAARTPRNKEFKQVVEVGGAVGVQVPGAGDEAGEVLPGLEPGLGSDRLADPATGQVVGRR